jgi:hypothetical protein
MAASGRGFLPECVTAAAAVPPDRCRLAAPCAPSLRSPSRNSNKPATGNSNGPPRRSPIWLFPRGLKPEMAKRPTRHPKVLLGSLPAVKIASPAPFVHWGKRMNISHAAICKVATKVEQRDKGYGKETTDPVAYSVFVRVLRCNLHPLDPGAIASGARCGCKICSPIRDCCSPHCNSYQNPNGIQIAVGRFR